MSMQAFLQDYIEEVQEHLLAMEKSLLMLEKEGADQEQISHVFRAAHSLKGASAYMGFEGLAALTHEMETQIIAIQLNSGAIPTNGITVLLESVDLISSAVQYVKEKGTEPALDTSFLQSLRNAFSPGTDAGDSPKKPPADQGSNGTDAICQDLSHELTNEFEGEEASPAPPLAEAPEFESLMHEEDEELLSIFTRSFRENYSSLLDLLKSSSGASLPPDEKEKALEIIKKLISSAQYMDYQPVVAILADWEKYLGGSNGAGPGRLEVLELLQIGGTRLEIMIPGLGVYCAADLEQVGQKLPIEDEDEELFSIFLDSFQQNFSLLAEKILSPSPTDQDLDRASELTGNLTQSSHYMDYEDIVELLNIWNESLEILKGREKRDPAKLQETFAALCSELPNRLTGLLIPDLKAGQDEGETFKSIDTEMDLLFRPSLDIETEPIGTGFSPAPATERQAIPEPDEQEKNLVAAPGEVRPAMPAQTLYASDSDAVEKKERTVLHAEDISRDTATLRVDAQKVDQLLNQVGELVVTRSEFIQTATLFRDVLRDMATQGILPKSELRRLRLLGFRLNESTQSLGRVANDLQASVMRVRMLPIMQLFERFPRVVRDQALKLGKKVELIIEGGETEIDKRVLERMNDPLIQFIRNALVHGIETPRERRLAGKPETGTIRLAAYQAGDYVAIEVEDDGRGIDTQKLRDLLANHKDFSRHELDRLSDEEISHAIFLPGISTYANVDGAAGRGVGLDVVKENVEHMSGSIEVSSGTGVGTQFVIRIPLTVAIIKALLVREADQIFTLPLNSVSEILRYRPQDTHSIEGFPVISLRGRTIPLVDLRQLLNMGPGPAESGRKFVVIVATSFREVGLVVDGLMGEREVVIKSIDNGVQPIQGFSGATILGDGRVSLIIDVSAMLKMMKNAFAAARPGASASGLVH